MEKDHQVCVASDGLLNQMNIRIWKMNRVVAIE